MGDETECVRAFGLFDEFLGIRCKLCQLTVGAHHQHVLSAGSAGLVMHFFASKQEHAFASFLQVAIDALHQNVVVGGDEHIQAGFHGSLGELSVRSRAIREGCVGVNAGD